MRERLTYAFPLIVAAVVPLAGLTMAAIRLGERRRQDAAALAGASLLGALIWVLALSA